MKKADIPRNLDDESKRRINDEFHADLAAKRLNPIKGPRIHVNA